MRLRHIMVIVSLSAVLAGPLQSSSLSLLSVEGLAAGDSLVVGGPITFYLKSVNTEGANIQGITNGFQVYSLNGAEWTDMTADTLVLGKTEFDLIWSIGYFGVTGSGADTVGFGGSRMFGTGMPADFDDTLWSLTIGPIDTVYGGGQICLDSAYYPPNTFAWKWAVTSTVAAYPTWDGPHCWPIENPVIAMRASVSSVEFAVDGNQPEDQVFTILISDGSTDKTVDVSGALDAKAGGYLTFTPSSGTHGTEITVSLDASGMGIGDYTGTITLSSSETWNPTFDIDVGVSVISPLSVRYLTDESALPTTFSLSQNYPNPFNPTTDIAFDLPVRSHVTLTVYNVLGQQVTTLVNKPLAAGSYVADWDGRSSSGQPSASGIYFYRLQTEQFTQTKKMVLLK